MSGVALLTALSFVIRLDRVPQSPMAARLSLLIKLAPKGHFVSTLCGIPRTSSLVTRVSHRKKCATVLEFAPWAGLEVVPEIAQDKSLLVPSHALFCRGVERGLSF